MLSRLALMVLFLASSSDARAERWLLIGGGPTPAHNEVSIERNTAFVDELVGDGERRVLFADGTMTTPHVQYRDPSSGAISLRPARLPRLDAPASAAGLDSVWYDFAAEAGAGGLVVYFAGHGLPDRALLWSGEVLSVQGLVARLAELPAAVPVILLMTQCYAGGFAQALFEDGDAARPLLQRDIAGFFAAPPDRMSAGCTPELDEASYDDFTTHFFGALAGVDRLGRPRAGADYDEDGRVGMDEAYAYTLVASDSIDVPTTTSDALLRHLVPLADAEVFTAGYSEVHALATAAQRAALDGLSHQLGATGEARLLETYELWLQESLWPAAQRDAVTEAKRLRLLRLAKSIVLRERLARSGDPALARLVRLEALEAGNPLGERPPRYSRGG